MSDRGSKRSDFLTKSDLDRLIAHTAIARPH